MVLIDMTMGIKNYYVALALMITLVVSAYGQTEGIVRAEAIENSISLAIEVNGTEYKVGDFIDIKYRVRRYVAL